MDTPRRRVPGMLALGGALVVGLALRLATAPTVFREEGVVFHGTDAYYHMRRVAYGLAHFPDVLQFDRYIHHPEGAAPIWPPYFDGMVAGMIRLLGVTEAPAAERLAALVPPALGALAILLVLVLAQRVSGRVAAAGAAFTLALLGGHVEITKVGFLDHHALMGVLVALFLLAGVPALRLEAGRRRLLPAMGLGLVVAAAILFWPGCVVLLFLSAAAAVTLALWRARDRALVTSLLLGPGLTSHAVAALVLALGCRGSFWAERGLYRLTTLSWFQPLVAAAVAAVFGIALVVVHLTGTTRVRLLAALGGGAAVAAALLLWLVPDAVHAALDAFQWVAREEQFQASVKESLPLFAAEQSLLTGPAPEALSLLVYLFPVLLAAEAWAVYRSKDPSRLLLFWCLVTFACLTLLQRRFVDFLAVPLSLLVGARLADLLAWLRARASRGSSAAGASRFLVVPLFVAAFYPSLRFAPRELANLVRGGGEDAGLSRLRMSQLELYRTARWMQSGTPATSGYLDPTVEPEYGVFCFWDLGHVFEYVGQRPTVVDNFGDDLGGDHYQDSLALYSSTSEAEVTGILRKYRAPILVTRKVIDAANFVPANVTSRLHFLDGKETEVGSTARVPAVQHFRLLFESRSLPPQKGAPATVDAALYKIWELVAGAVLTGTAAPGEQVFARLRVRTQLQRTFQYETSTPADATGRFQLRMPYSTDPSASQVTPLGEVQVRWKGQSVAVHVPDAAVREGAVVLVPPGSP